MTCRHIVLRNREEACQARFGREQVVAILIQRAVGGAIPDGKQLSLGVEQEAELHRERHGARFSFEREQPSMKISFTLVRLRHIALPALDRALSRLRPEEQVAVRGVFMLARQSPSTIGEIRGVSAGIAKPRRDVFRCGRLAAKNRCDSRQRIRELMTRERLRTSVIWKREQRVASEKHCVLDALNVRRIRNRDSDPLTARIRDRDEMRGQVAAVDRGNVRRFEGPQVACVIPVIEVAAESLQFLQGCKRRLQALDDLQRSRPAEVARADGAQKIQADIRRRGAMRQDRVRILLKVVRRQHVICRGHERFEEAPGTARDEAQGIAVGRGDGQATGDQRATR